MRIVVIGATGHVGGYLIPRLVGAGHEVLAMSRGLRSPYRADPAWQQVVRITADREAEDAAGTFAGRIADLKADVVVDMVCFTPESARQLVEPLCRSGTTLLSCGSIWVHGPAAEVPVSEDAPRHPLGSYGIGKAAIEEVLQDESRRRGLRAVVLHPGHISGPGWPVINPAGNLDPGIWQRLAAGELVTLPNFGLETVHHVHADDVAQAFALALDPPPSAIGESFHIVSPRAVTLRGFAEAAARWSGKEANLEFVPFEQFRQMTAAGHADVTYEHISRSPSMSIAKAAQLLGYVPKYTSLQAVAEAVRWLRDAGQLDRLSGAGGP